MMNYFSCSDRVYEEMVKDDGNHANFFETALMMYLRPDLVKTGKMVDEQVRNPVFDYKVDQRSKTGVMGKPSLASAQEG